MLFAPDIFNGAYVLTSKKTGEFAALTPDRSSLEPTTEPNHVEFFATLEHAQAAAGTEWNVHRVEGLPVLKPEFTY